MTSWFLLGFLWFPVLFWRFSSSFPPSVLFPCHFSASTSVLSAVRPRVCSIISLSVRPVCFTWSCSRVFECLLVYVFCFLFLHSHYHYCSELRNWFALSFWMLPCFVLFCVSTWFVDAQLFFFFCSGVKVAENGNPRVKHNLKIVDTVFE